MPCSTRPNKVVARDKTTLKELIIEGLREALAKRRSKEQPFKLKDFSFTADRDFSLFPQLKTHNPLVAAAP
jgi:hypothetical protein